MSDSLVVIVSSHLIMTFCNIQVHAATAPPAPFIDETQLRKIIADVQTFAKSTYEKVYGIVLEEQLSLNDRLGEIEQLSRSLPPADKAKAQSLKTAIEAKEKEIQKSLTTKITTLPPAAQPEATKIRDIIADPNATPVQQNAKVHAIVASASPDIKEQLKKLIVDYKAMRARANTKIAETHRPK